MLALIKQLIEEVGVAQEDIFLGDPFRTFHDLYWNVCHSVYPDVVYCDGNGDNGRHQTVPSSNQEMIFSDGKFEYRIPQEYIDSEYFINLPCLKSHDSGGITLGAKNHQGSILQDGSGSDTQSAIDMHYSLPDHDNTDGGVHRYRHLVDYLAHEQLGGKTLLTIIDGIWAGRSWQGLVEKWNMEPFNGDYPSSLFISQDLVAIDAVCFDFLLEEYKNKPSGDKHPYMQGTDDFLFQAADPANWADGISYDPEGDGNPVSSLGVYEHWNNASDKKYSKNLGSGDGIELIAITSDDYLTSTYEIKNDNNFSLKAYPNPAAENLIINYNLNSPSKVTAEIFTLNGRKVDTIQQDFKSTGIHAINYNCSNLKKGFYVVQLTVDGESNAKHSTFKFEKR
jgi:hypothetical protein